MNKAFYGLLGLLIGGASAAAGFYSGKLTDAATAEPMVVEAAAATDDEAIGKVVREYLLKNPEILIEVQTALQNKQEEQERVARSSALKNNEQQIFASADDAVLGNPQGDVTVVEFFDYNCGYCRRAVEDMQTLIKSDPNIRFVLKELPILGPDSVKAHVVAQAFKRLMPEKYGEFHVALLTSGHADEDSAIAIAKSLGADEAKLRSGMEAPEIGKHFEEASLLAQSLAINGTPAYVIKDTIVPGALGHEALAQKIANVRKCQSATC